MTRQLRDADLCQPLVYRNRRLLAEYIIILVLVLLLLAIQVRACTFIGSSACRLLFLTSATLLIYADKILTRGV